MKSVSFLWGLGDEKYLRMRHPLQFADPNSFSAVPTVKQRAAYHWQFLDLNPKRTP